MTTDVYTRVTDKIIADLEHGERPWMKPWNAEHAAGKITRPLRFNGLPYSGINILMLWAEAVEKGYTAPIWMTFKQAQELGGHVRKGEHGSLVVYANTVTKTEHDEENGLSARIHADGHGQLPEGTGRITLDGHRRPRLYRIDTITRNQAM